MSNEFKQLSREMKRAINEEMRLVLELESEPSDNFLGMLHYHMGWLDSDLRPTNVNSGKQIRPLVCLLCCMAAGGDWHKVVPAAAALELLHNFSLIHDDIQDASPTRRGRLTLWKIWGIEQAINVGDAMFAISHLAMARLTEHGIRADIVVQALRRFDETCLHLTRGQHADIDFEKRNEVNVDDYVVMITGKTAVLLSLCAELGALIAGCDEDTITHYATFGLNLGLAFQIKDDILGIWGDEKITGKSTATDVTTKKKTLPVLYGLSKSETLRQYYAESENGNEFVSKVTQTLEQIGAYDFASKKATQYSESSLNHLTAAQPSGPAAKALLQLAEMLLSRDF